MMNSYERTRILILGAGGPAALHAPLHRVGCATAGIAYPEFVYQPEKRAEAYLACAGNFR